MKPLHLCREALSVLRAQPRSDELDVTIKLLSEAQKFILPEGGRAIFDPLLRGLQSGAQPLRLPFPRIALEYQAVACDEKHIAIAAECSEGRILLQQLVSIERGTWAPCSFVSVANDDYGEVVDGSFSVKLRIADDGDNMPYVLADEAAISVLAFLNALACSNVSSEVIKPSAVRMAMLKRGALPYDSYRILVIEGVAARTSSGGAGAHRSPREHLRRGHIRRLANGNRIWVNATIVAAGRGAGKVAKDYGLHAFD